MQHVRAHDVFDYTLYQGKTVYAFRVHQIVYVIQKYMYSVLKLNKLILYYSRLWAWNGLLLNTYISMYAITNRCYNEQGSRTNHVCSSIPHCIYTYIYVVQIHFYISKNPSYPGLGTVTGQYVSYKSYPKLQMICSTKILIFNYEITHKYYEHRAGHNLLSDSV